MNPKLAKLLVKYFYRRPLYSLYIKRKEGFYKKILPLLYKSFPNINIGENNIFTSPKNLAFLHDKSTLQIGDNNFFSSETKLYVYEEGSLKIGNSCIMWKGHIGSRFKVTIGNMFAAAENFVIEDSEGHPVDPEWRKKQIAWFIENRKKKEKNIKPHIPLSKEEKQFIDKYSFAAMPPIQGYNVDEIVIGDNVWIGRNVTIRKGARIGNNCVIAAGAVVTKEIPPNCVAGGIPAKPLKRLDIIDFNKTMEKIRKRYPNYQGDPACEW